MKRLVRIDLVLGLALLALCPALRADCSAPQANSAGPVNHVILDTTALPSGYQDELNAAQNAWNSSSCNSGGHSPESGGHSFPMFSTTGFGTTYQVVFHTGLNPTNNQSCGKTNFGSKIIDLYGTAMKPSGGSFNCTQTNILTDTMSHELGHILGLADQGGGPCSSVAMSQVGFNSTGGYVDRSVKPEECQEADQKTQTLSEARAACDPDSEVPLCTSTPNPNTCEPCSCS